MSDKTDLQEECVKCGAFAGFETSPEGSNCAICGDWICNECEDHKVSGDIGCICKECSTKHNLHTYDEAIAFVRRV